MGCDIHFYVERRDGDKWITCDEWVPSEWDQSSLEVRKSFYKDRCYDLFGILADVRNGSGFAGAKTGEGFVPISAPRGLPNDLSPELQREADEGMDHTPSWLTLRELLDYDWTRTTTKRGLISACGLHEWERWDRKRGYGPSSYCDAIYGQNVEIISEDGMRARIGEVKASLSEGADIDEALSKAMPNVYCDVSWKTPYYRAARGFWSETMPRLLQLGKPEDVRCVFWFDS